MAKRKTKRQAKRLFNSLFEMMEQAAAESNKDLPLEMCSLGKIQVSNGYLSATLEDAQKSGETPKMKKFRFQLLHQWLTQNFEPCRIADIGGGKGLLTYLLRKSGWEATVIDPVYQPLPEKYKDITLNKRIKISSDEKVPHISKEFEPYLAKYFDILVGMHAHACNVKIIDAAAEFNRHFVLLPCCIVDEPIHPVTGVHWLECLADYAIQKGFMLHPFRLNFRGQNIGFHSIPRETNRSVVGEAR